MYTGKKSHDAILGSGLFLMISGIVLLCCFAFDITPNMLIAIPIVIILAGAFFLFLYYTRKKLVRTAFLGYFLTSSGIFSLIVCFRDFSLSIGNLWPFFVLFCGLSSNIKTLFIRLS